MRVKLNTKSEECIVKLSVKTESPTKIRVELYDANLPDTVLTDRYKTVDGKFTFLLRCPIVGNKSVLRVFDEDNPSGKDDFEITEIKRLPLDRKIDKINLDNPTIREFCNFASCFCFYFSTLKPNYEYKSDNGKFIFRYIPTIRNRKNGKTMTTPSRIGAKSGIIECSDKFLDYTVPGRFGILCHEFAHLYLNDKAISETQADENGLLLYLSLGFPRIEAELVWLDVFIGAPTMQNKKRYDRLRGIIRNFDKSAFVK